jgi:hypothetical protein
MKMVFILELRGGGDSEMGGGLNTKPDRRSIVPNHTPVRVSKIIISDWMR